MKTEQNHAITNAAAWLESIGAMVAALHEAENADEGDESTDNARQTIQESPLSVQVRGGWYDPCDPQTPRQAPEEFEVLLSTGGPALRIIGELDEYGQSVGCKMQWQDWGTPWTDYMNDSDENSLLKFCQQFYFGE